MSYLSLKGDGGFGGFGRVNDNPWCSMDRGPMAHMAILHLGFELGAGQRLVHQEDGIPETSDVGCGISKQKGPQVAHGHRWHSEFFLANSGTLSPYSTGFLTSSSVPLSHWRHRKTMEDKSSKMFKDLQRFALRVLQVAWGQLTPRPAANALHFGQVHSASQRKTSKVCAALLCRTTSFD